MKSNRSTIQAISSSTGNSTHRGGGAGSINLKNISVRVRMTRRRRVSIRRTSLAARCGKDRGDVLLSEVAVKNWSRAQASLARCRCSRNCCTNSMGD